MSNSYYIGLDIGGTKCAVVLGNEKGTVLQRQAFESGKAIPPEQILLKFSQEIEKILEGSGLTSKEITAIGISCGGPLDSKKGIIFSPPNLPLWDKVNIKAYFENKYNIPTFLQNDANACAIAEWRFGAGKGTRNMIFLTFGTGIGAGLILDGKIYTGTNDLAGEVGHIRLSDDGPLGYGKKGSFEGYCSGGGIKHLAYTILMERLNKGEKIVFCPTKEAAKKITAKDVCIAAENGDPIAIEIINISAEYLGRGLAILIDILNPECIVIGSIFARSESLFRTRMQQVIDKEALELMAKVCRILPAALGDSIGDVAALTVAIENS